MTSSPPIDLLALFARFGRAQKLSLRDPRTAEKFIASAKAGVEAAISNDTLLHGQRAQNMFEALIVSLGNYRLFKTEDIGQVHPSGTYTAPDFRIVLNGGVQWLIEVKNAFDRDPLRQRIRLRPNDLNRLKCYAEAVECPLKLAFYWGRWGLWTLVNPTDLVESGGKLTIDMARATQLSELASLGDCTVGTTPPLKLRLIADRSKERSLSPSGEANFYIDEVRLYSGNNEISDSIEQNIAWIFMQFGNWHASEPRAILSGDAIDAIEFEWQPRERANPNENFEMIGSLSSMFSRYYAEQTLSSDGVVQTEAAMIPNWFAPLVDPQYKSKVLPLWRFLLRPNRGDLERSASRP